MANKKYNFGAGPCILPDIVLNRASDAVKNYNKTGLSILEISHRSSEFEAVINECGSLVRELLSVPDNYSILDMVTNDETGYTLMDTIADKNSPAAEASLMLESFNIDLDQTLKILPFRQEMILKMFFGIGQTAQTLDDLSVLFNRSKERVRQLKDEALMSLRLYLKGNPGSMPKIVEQ